ncbi:hypothetical protein [Ovoidimarina sediminis]|uniref:hypothetical protein n=1 Tax=Ovoidimarina sediminis TaxID=3079856 RepID=UPI002909D7C1|nr:hypothetical protein [Rhodophyticola sp. MJ-SS7]MDU8945169.1 hypothetical protein [Rhodophyticola sp. MJ-SS7]
MQRLALAVILVAVLVVAAVVVLAGLRRVLQGPDAAQVPAHRATGVQKTAFALLVALVLYVAFQGAG